MGDKPTVMSNEVDIDCTGYNIKADWYEGSDNDAGVLLVLPGYTSTKAKYAAMVKVIVAQTGMSALVIDYSGHGVSPFNLGDLSRAQNSAEVIKTFDWIVNSYPDRKITIMGTSYGGYHTAYLTKFRQFENIIFRVPATYPEEEMHHIYSTMKDRHGGDYRFKKENYIDHWLFTHADSVRGRALLVTHELDTVCPPVSTMPFARAFNADHWEAKGFEHGFGFSDVTEQQIEDYYKKLADWLNK